MQKKFEVASRVTQRDRNRAFLNMCALALLGAAGAACDEDKPYTPFQVATSLPGALPAPQVKPGKVEEKAAIAPVAARPRQPAAVWKIFGRELRAPSGTELHVALPSPTDGSDEIFAWALPKTASEQAGLWAFGPSGAAERRLLSLPDFLPRGQDCRFQADLSPAGASTLTSDVLVVCESKLLPGTPQRSLAVIDPSRDSPTLVHLRLIAENIGETLSVKATAEDRDEDGSADPQFLIALTSPLGKTAELPLRFLSRVAGASREADAPRSELTSLISRIKVSVNRKAERDDALKQLDALRRLLSSLCAESGVAKIQDSSGTPFPCGDLTAASLGLSSAAITAYLWKDEMPAALGEYAQVDWFYGKKSDKDRAALEKLLLEKIPHKEARRLARFEVDVYSSTTAPYASPLYFTSEGQLWAQMKDGVTKRLTRTGDPPLLVPATDDAPEVRVEEPSWTLHPAGPAGMTLMAALPSCERSEVQLMFTDTTGTASSPAPPVPLSLLAPRPGICKSLRPFDLGATPLYSEGGQLVLALGGGLAHSGGRVHGLAAPPSPISWATPLGIAISDGKGVRLLTGPLTSGLHHCVTNHKGDEVACVGSSQASGAGKSGEVSVLSEVSASD